MYIESIMGSDVCGNYAKLSRYRVPVAGVTLSVTVFLLLGIYGKVIWMVISAIILGIGHIGIHLEHRKVLLR